MQILKGLYQVGGDLMGLTWDGEDASFCDGNSYVLERPEGLVLIDCGCGDTWPQTEANIRYWGLDPECIHSCLLTHPHLDHAGAAHLLKHKGVHLIAHTETADAVRDGDERCCGYLYHKTFTPVEVDETVQDGDTVQVLDLQFEVMHLPGHSMGCTAYFLDYDGKRLVFSGDVIGTLGYGDFGWDGSIDFNKEVYIRSLRRFAKEDTDIMLPGHGMIYFHQPRRRVEDVLNQALIQWR